MRWFWVETWSKKGLIHYYDYTNVANRIVSSFVWSKFLSVGIGEWWDELKNGQKLKLGDSHVTPRNIQEVQASKLGDALIRLKRIYNFWCSMLVFTPFALCFVTLCGVFMRFPELTYWQDTIVPVLHFLLFLCFRKATQEIFSELDETSSRTPIFPGRRTKTEREPEGGQGPASHQGGMA
jgi:hypothetical protein